MSTRGVIARKIDNGFAGVYHHWDSYPSGLGKTLYKLYNGHFHQNLDAMLSFLIDKHPAGWSTINHVNFDKPAGWDSEGPNCYCHGDRHEEAWEVNDKNAAGSGCEYAYVFTPDAKMLVLSSYDEGGDKMIGMFGCGDENATWHLMKEVDLKGEEPDWENM